MLDEAGLRENTIVVYTADHGDMCGGHRMLDKHYVLYDDVVKVPLIVRWPGVIDGNTICDQFVYNMLDLPPTLLEAANLQVPAFMQGQSLLPLFRNEISEPWREYVMSTFNGQQFGLYIQRMLRTKHWKYIWNPTDVDELYDLTHDPEELHNRIHDRTLADLIKDFRKNLYEELKRVGDRSVDGQWLRRQLIVGEKY
jgi:arylsulfatase A-like enzyme